MVQNEKLKDFRNFLYLVWKELGLPDPTPVQYDIAYAMQHGTKRQVIEAYRGVGKSWIASAFVVFNLYWNPALNILVVSASKQRADDFTTFTLRLLTEIAWLNHLYPQGEQRCSKVAFDVFGAPPAHAPSVRSVGITGQITGSRADLIIPDDIEVANNSWTPGMREKLLESIKEFDAVLKPGETSRICFLGTPQSGESIYTVLGDRGYTIRIWPARMPNEKQRRAYGNKLAPYISELPLEVGEPVDPDRFDDLDLQERELSYGRSGFNLQFMLDTSISDSNRYPLKLSELIVDDLDVTTCFEKYIYSTDKSLAWDIETVGFSGDRYYRPLERIGKPVAHDGRVLAIDPSGRGKDELGYTVLGKSAHNMVLLANGGLRGGYAVENLTKLAQLAKDYQVNEIIYEANFGDGMWAQIFTPILKEIYPCTLTEVKHSVQKERRIIETLEPIINRHHLIVDRRLIEKDLAFVRDDHPELGVEQRLKYSLMYQLSHITLDRGSLIHDDRLDSLAIAVNYWVERMGASVDEALARRKAELWEKELEQFLEHAIDPTGKPPEPQPSWLQSSRGSQRLPGLRPR